MSERLLKYIAIVALAASAGFDMYAQTEEPDSIFSLDEYVVKAPTGARKLRGVSNTELITSAELSRAACCNLGESFSTNPSVDVNYTDAATGARQIRLLGLAGTYVQMLNENIPAMRGAAAPYGLSYIPGPWIQSMQVSKGASSVKNGYESVTGQINVEMKKPQTDPSLSVNMYYDSENKLEANVDGNLHFGKKWSGGLLTHYEHKFTAHDGDDDGFIDMPKIRQINLMPRIAYLGTDYVFQAAAKVLNEKRESGQSHHAHLQEGLPLYEIGIKTTRIEAFTKNAYIFDHESDGNVALILSGNYHDSKSFYGVRQCDILDRNIYSQLMFERKWSDLHALSTGLTFNYDNYHYGLLLNPEYEYDNSEIFPHEHETVVGGYAQYTLNLDEKLIAMGGLRYDHSSLYGSMVTPRVHLRYNPTEQLSIHASAGRGSHSPHPYAEYSYLLASSREFRIEGRLQQESAWNLGGGASLTLSPFERNLTLSAEYYYTDFSNQLMVDLDANPHEALIFSSSNKSYSHSLQFELNWEPFDDFSFMAAWRLNDVKVDYGRGLQQKPLMSRHKALFTLNYAPNMGIWQFDVSCAINGGGVMPTPYTLSDGSRSWSPTFKAFPTLNTHITRNFRHWSVYVGGENLTGYRQKNPVVGASNPWGKDFDATMIYGPLHGAMFYVGFRYNITKYL